MAGERTEKATPKRRSEARRKGQIARSTEVNSTVVLLSAVTALAVTASATASNLRALMTETMGRIAQPDVSSETIAGLIQHWASVLGELLLPVLVAAAAGGLIANIAQNRPSVTVAALKPDFRKLSPVAGLKRMVGLQSVAEFIKALGKVAIVAVAAVFVVWPEIPRLTRLGDLPPAAIADLAVSLLARLAFVVIAVLVPLAIADYLFQKRQYEKSLRMSKQEVKEEQRQQDIAPEVKGALRRRQMQMSRQRMLAQVPSADVIVTNPTHFAVAMRYGRDLAAPRVVAKGADLVARRIREIAEEYEITIVENKALARALYHEVEVDQEIPPAFFAAVAEVLAFVYRTSRRKLSWV
jgi:flagellar biosynthetic protein FlhB